MNTLFLIKKEKQTRRKGFLLSAGCGFHGLFHWVLNNIRIVTHLTLWNLETVLVIVRRIADIKLPKGMVRTWIIPHQIHPEAFNNKKILDFAQEFYYLLQDDLIYEAQPRVRGKRVSCISHRCNVIEHLSRLSCLPKSRQSLCFYIVKRRCSDVDIIPLKESQILELSAH